MPPEYCQPHVHNLHSPGIFLQAVTGIAGPSLTISTACSSSAKVFASAARWINHGLVDAVLVGGVDSLCMSILYGFNSLELVSAKLCRPFDRRRDGINIGESCGYALLARDDLDDAGRIDWAYRLAVGRHASDEQRESALAFIQRYGEVAQEEGKGFGDLRLQAWTRFCQALVASAEFQILN